MIARLIHWSIGNRFLVLLATLFITALGIWSLRNTPLDALPDLSDTQVIIRTSFRGQAPQTRWQARKTQRQREQWQARRWAWRATE